MHVRETRIWVIEYNLKRYSLSGSSSYLLCHKWSVSIASSSACSATFCSIACACLVRIRQAVESWNRPLDIAKLLGCPPPKIPLPARNCPSPCYTCSVLIHLQRRGDPGVTATGPHSTD